MQIVTVERQRLRHGGAGSRNQPGFVIAMLGF
jgi:hypothetical protein